MTDTNRTSNERVDSTELYYAEMEAARNTAEDAYFRPRSDDDNAATRRTFRAGFERAFKSLWKPSPSETNAYPTWQCPNCGAVDEFNVQHDTLPNENDRVVITITCRICELKCTDGRSETSSPEEPRETSRDDARDAARYRYLRERLACDRLAARKLVITTEGGREPYRTLREAELDREIDECIGLSVEPTRNQASAASTGAEPWSSTPRGTLPNSLGTGGAGSHPGRQFI